jgi:hypothetical protein
MEKKIGAMAILIALGLGFSMVFTMDEIVTRPIEVVTYEGEKPCSWLQEGMPHRLEYITNPQHGWVDR